MKKSHSLFVFLGSKPAVGSASWALVGRVRNCFHDTTLPVVSFRETLVCNCFLNYYKKWISKQISKVGVVTLCDVMSLLCHEAFLMWLCSFTSLKVIQDVKNCKLTFWLCLFFSFLLASLWWNVLTGAPRNSGILIQSSLLYMVLLYQCTNKDENKAKSQMLLLLLNQFSRIRLCATPEMVAHQAPHPWDSPGKNTGVGCHFLLQCMKVKSESEVTQSCLTLSDPMDCSLPGSSAHGICQARVLEWGAIAFSAS